MPTFAEWYNEAVGKSGDLARVAENANRPARYDSAYPQAQREFQDTIAAEWPGEENAYNEACRGHHLKGERVREEHLAPRLTRLVDARHLEKGLLAAMGGGPYRGPDPFRDRPSVHRWAVLADILANDDLANAGLFVPARPVDKAHPEDRAVFATYDPADTGLDAGGQPRCAFVERIRTCKRSDEQPADCAVRLLATDRRPATRADVKSHVFIYFPRERVGECRFPVPADAGWQPFFRAVLPGDGHVCGRSCPDGSSEAEHRRGRCGENEVVHRNMGIPCREVHVIALGETSAIGTGA